VSTEKSTARKPFLFARPSVGGRIFWWRLFLSQFSDNIINPILIPIPSFCNHRAETLIRIFPIIFSPKLSTEMSRLFELIASFFRIPSDNSPLRRQDNEILRMSLPVFHIVSQACGTCLPRQSRVFLKSAALWYFSRKWEFRNSKCCMLKRAAVILTAPVYVWFSWKALEILASKFDHLPNIITLSVGIRERNLLWVR